MHLRKSKLESYEAILGIILSKPLNIDRLAYKVNMDCTVLRRHIDFLVQNGLVEERFFPKGTFYAATERGGAVLKTLGFQRYFKKMQDTVLAIEDSMQVSSATSKRKQK
jgi:predicted transcriptional regulator